MSTAVWIILVIAVLAIIALLVMLPRMRAQSSERAEARHLEPEADRVEPDGRDDTVVQDERSGRFDRNQEARGEGLDEREVAHEQGREDGRTGDRPAARRDDA